MAGTKTSDYAVDTPNWTELLETMEKQRKGYMCLSLTNYNNSDKPAIEAGSYVEVSGALYGFSSEEAIPGAGTTANINYIMLDPTPITFSWTTTAPIWSTTKHGWYNAGQTKRYVGECRYDNPNYRSKQDYGNSYQSRGDGIPEGTIVAQIPGYFGDGNNGSYTAVSIPLISKWKECDGAALNDSLSIIFNGAGRYLPNLTDDRFLQGDVFGSIGGIGGNNAMIDHSHGSHHHKLFNINSSSTKVTASNYPTVEGENAVLWDYTIGGTATVPTIGKSANASIGSGSVPGSTNNRPKYLACQYIMKVRA